MVTEAKKQEVEELRASFKEAKSVVMANLTGVNVESITGLRRKMRQADVRLKVVKNTLARLAVKETSYDIAEGLFTGPVCVAFSFGEDIAAPARVLLDFSKESENVRILGGVVEGSILDEHGVKSLAATPPKPVVQAMLLGVMQAPARNFLGVMEGVARKFLYALNAVAEKKKEEG